MTKIRNQYLYKLTGQIRHKRIRKKAQYQQHFYQLNITCQNKPEIKKIFAFKDKLTNPLIWKELEQNGSLLSQRYLFSCRNYQGSYYLVDWEELDHE